jgi:hypothetical protein
MDGILNKIKIAHLILIGVIGLLMMLGSDWLKVEFWFTSFSLLYTLYSRHYLGQWPRLTSSDTSLLASLLDGLRVKRGLELILVLSGLCFGLISIWLPLGLAKAGVILCAVSALHLVMTLALEWEVGIHYDKGI